MTDEEISEDLIATIPELDAEGGEPIETTVLPEPEPQAEQPSGGDMALLLADIRRHFEEAFQREMASVEQTVGAALYDLGSQLQTREAEIAEARAELEQLREAHAVSEAKLEALKRALE